MHLRDSPLTRATPFSRASLPARMALTPPASAALAGLNDAVFSLRVDPARLSIAASDSVTAVAATGGLLWVGTESGRLIRRDSTTGVEEEVRGRLGVGRLDSAVCRIHADPFARAALVILRNADGYHVRASGPVRPRWLAKLRGLHCVSAAWVRVRRDGGGEEQAVALLGTAFGALFSLAVDDRNERDDVLARLWAAPGGRGIEGVRVERVAGKFVGAVATAEALYLFSDGPSLEELFVEERMEVMARRGSGGKGGEGGEGGGSEKGEEGVGDGDAEGKGKGKGKGKDYGGEGLKEDGNREEVVKGEEQQILPRELHFMTGNSGAASRRFVWAGERGVTHAQLAVRRRRIENSPTPDADMNARVSRSTVIASVMDKHLISWDMLKARSGSSVPLACNLSAFHVLILYSGSIYAFNQISGHLTQRVTLWSPDDVGVGPEMKGADWPADTSWARRLSPMSADLSSSPRNARDGSKRALSSWDDSSRARALSSPAAGLTRDVATDALWVYTEDGELARFVASNEEQNEAWKAAKAMRRFDLAMALAPLVSSGMPNDAAMFQTREAVLEAQADYAASEGNWDVAAQLYAKTSRPIESVLLDIAKASSHSAESQSSDPPSSTKGSNLRLLGAGPRLATAKHITTYLVRKLDRTSSSKPMQRTIMATMLVQLYASRLSSEIDKVEREAVRKDFGFFLADRHADLDVHTALTVLCRNGCHEEAWQLAVLSGDILSASELSARRGNIDQTLSLLKNPLVTDDEDLMSRLVGNLSNSLVPQAPHKVSTSISRALKKDTFNLDHMTVVQGLARVARGVRNEETVKEAYRSAIAYLFELLHEWSALSGRGDPSVVEGNTRSDWYNLVTVLFQLHAEFGGESEAQRSYDHLVAPRLCKDMSDMTRDALGAILRSAISAGFLRLCVYLYQALGLHVTAIRLAVDIDVKLAEIKVGQLGQTGMPENLQRSLWRLVASKSDDPVGVVERSKGLLHIEDVLTSMGQFESATERVKAAVADSLEEHKRLANAAKSDATGALEVTSNLREDLERARRWQDEHQKQRLGQRRRTRAFSCGHRATSATPRADGKKECALCGTEAIFALDAPFDSGHSLPLTAGAEEAG